MSLHWSHQPAADALYKAFEALLLGFRKCALHFELQFPPMPGRLEPNSVVSQGHSNSIPAHVRSPVCSPFLHLMGEHSLDDYELEETERMLADQSNRGTNFAGRGAGSGSEDCNLDLLSGDLRWKNWGWKNGS